VTVILLAGFGGMWVKVTERVTAQISPLFQTVAGAFGKEANFFQNKLFEGPGKFFQTMLGGEDARFDRPQDMLCVGYLHPFLLTVCSIWAVGRASSAIAGEIDRGTMELLLAQPIARSKIVAAHLMVDLTVIPIIVLALWLGTATGVTLLSPFQPDLATLEDLGLKPADVAPQSVSARMMLPGVLNTAGLLFALSGLTIFLSSMGRSRWRVIGMSIVIVLVMFVVNVLGQLWDGIAFLRPFSVFFYYQPQKIVLRDNWSADFRAAWGDGLPEVNVVLVLLAVGAVGYLMAWRSFARRDIPAPL